jgi:predicted glycosyltransferase
LTRRGKQCVLGLRDVMDEPNALFMEWQRKGVFPALKRYYRDIWVYGLPEIFDPIREIQGHAAAGRPGQLHGLYRAHGRRGDRLAPELQLPDRPYILVTAGGGGDGAGLIDWVCAPMRAIRASPIRPF